MMNTDLTAEKELIEGIIRGDQVAFREIFYRYKDKLCSYCYMFTKSDYLSEEIVHDVLLKIWMDREHINPELSFSSYLYTITRNYALNFLKKVASDAHLREQVIQNMEQGHNEPENLVVYDDLNRIAHKAISLLPEQRQLIYRMSREQYMRYDEIADQLGISRNTVRNQIVQALKDIKSYLRKHAELKL